MYDFLNMLANPVGLIGVVLVLITYFLLSIGRMHANTVSFQFINFLGALLILFSLCFYWNLSSVIIEIAWMIISLIGIFRAVTKT